MRRRSAVRLVAVVVAAVAAFATVTVVALEGREVVVLRTTGASGTHETRTWIADDGDGALVEAANPERPFLHDVEANPIIALRRAGSTRRCQATALPNPDGHLRVRRLLAEKYGWADRWIGCLADTSRSIAVHIECP